MAQVEKKRKERFEVFPTELPGVQLRIEPGAKLDILRKTIEAFYPLAKQFAEVKFQIDELNTQQTPRREEIISVAKEHEGLRGLTSEKDNFVLTVTPKESITWDRESLKKSLEIAYPAVVRETLTVNLSIPIGAVTTKEVTITEEGMEKAIKEALVNLGISERELAMVMHREVGLSVDEEKLEEMIERGQVKLLEGAKTSEITWAARVDRLKK